MQQKTRRNYELMEPSNILRQKKMGIIYENKVKQKKKRKHNTILGIWKLMMCDVQHVI